VVAALVTLCREAGASSVTVMDHPFGGTAEQAYKISQIGDAVKAAGGQMVVMSSVKFQESLSRKAKTSQPGRSIRMRSSLT